MATLSEKYSAQEIEKKWQKVWDEKKVSQALNPSKDSKKRKKYYCLCMFPYPSGSIHMGHLRNYSIGDVISRFKRMQGYNVLQPIGWDAFGLPAENAAIQRKVHPQKWTLENIAHMKSEFKLMGIAYDWDREIATCLPEYYKWEQLLFQRFYKEGLAYKKTGQLNFCENCQTVLANEQVHEGKCWRCDNVVTLKEMQQWYLKITNYAKELLKDHDQLKGLWPDRVLDMQKHWIGESVGAKIKFKLESGQDEIEVFTTRPDTLFGVTFVTIAPTHRLSESLCVSSKKELQEIIKKVQAKKGYDETPEKNGFFTGSYCIHPVTQKKIPIWVGDFVVAEYGTGAVMGVPAHDERDFEFAGKYQLPIQVVIQPGTLEKAYTDAGTLQNSGEFDGLENEVAKTKITKLLETKKLGVQEIQYRLRDWGISRQRYWGAPIPMIYCESCGVVPVPEKDLPVVLPTDVEFTGEGNPLEKNSKFVNVSCPTCQKPARRETDTMDTFVESSWYYARFLSPKYDQGPFKLEDCKEWLPVDRYIGGIEHACMHLLYARFFHKVLRDWGYIVGDEPFKSLLSQGMVVKDGAKMSKSKGNVVSPTAIIEKYGADTGRLFSLFAAPPEKDLDWNEKGVEGCFRFLNRVYRLFFQFQNIFSEKLSLENISDSDLVKIRKKAHWTVKKMTEDIESDKFNTAISASMELVNEIYNVLATNEKVFETPAGKATLKESFEFLTKCLTPYAPHLCEELWHVMGNTTLVVEEAWPKFDSGLLEEATFLLIVQVNGKLRDKVEFSKTSTKEDIQKEVLNLEKVKSIVGDKKVKQFVYVPERLANVVV